ADATSKLRDDETIGGGSTHLIELTPPREDIGYNRIVLLLGTEDLVPRRLQIYQGGDAPQKRPAPSEGRARGPPSPPEHIEVETPSSGTKTVIDIADVQFNQNLDADLFTQRYLERGER